MIDSKIFGSPPKVILMWFGVFLICISILPILGKFPNWLFWVGLAVFMMGLISHIFQDKEENEATLKSAGDGLAEMPDSIAKAMERR